MNHPELDFQHQLLLFAERHGWRWFHSPAPDYKRTDHFKPGFPDLVLVRPPTVIFAELKSENGRLSTEQRDWINDLQLCAGVSTYVWRPNDWEAIKALLR